MKLIDPSRLIFSRTLWEKVALHVNSKERFTSEMHIGESEDHYLPLKITTETAWHSLFSRNMFIKPKNL